MIWFQLTVVGIAAGAFLALSGMGIVLTYKATGIFNFAHGAIGVLVAYVLFQLNSTWGVPVVLAALIALGVVAPGIGLFLERIVFRPLQRVGATTTEKLVATVGVLVATLGIIFLVWGAELRVGPAIFPLETAFSIGGVQVGWDDLGAVGLTLGVSAGLYYLFRFTHLGLEIRAVVDRPELAELASVNANRVAGIAWALGAVMAGMAGVLFATGALEPFRMTLFIIQTFAIAVVARLTNLPIALGTGIALGLAQAYLGHPAVHLFNADGVIGTTFEELKPNLPVVVLFAALLIYRRLDIVGETAERVQRLAAPVRTQSWQRTALLATLVGVGLLVLPAFLDVNGLARAQRFLAYSVIFASIVAVTGFSGQITLGQAGFAGVGAWGTAYATVNWGVPVIPAMFIGGGVALLAGLAAGWPALRRRGLFLGLTTLALGLLVYQAVLQNNSLIGGLASIDRPSLFGWTLDTPRAFYYYELVWVGLLLWFTRNLRAGRLGRALGAMRDSEEGARSVGIDLRNYKLFIFAASAFIAGIGGSLLTQQAEAFAPMTQFFPLESLFWFAVVVVAGVSSIFGAVLGAFIWVMLDVVLGTEGVSQFTIGIGALLLGRLPGGNLIGVLRWAGDRMTASGRRALAEARDEQKHPEVEIDPNAQWEPSDFADQVLAETGGNRERARERARTGSGGKR